MGNGAERPFPISFRPRIGQRLHLKSIFPRHSRGDRFHSVSFPPPNINNFILGTILIIHLKNSASINHFQFYKAGGIKICKFKKNFIILQKINKLKIMMNMKKIIGLIAAFAITMAANAQTVESSTLFENTYVTLSAGATTPILNEDWKPVIGLEFGKYITPVVGFSIEGVAKIGTLGTSTWINQHHITGNVKFNLSNWFAGYKGHPRIFEFVFVPGIG